MLVWEEDGRELSALMSVQLIVWVSEGRPYNMALANFCRVHAHRQKMDIVQCTCNRVIECAFHTIVLKDHGICRVKFYMLYSCII